MLKLYQYLNILCSFHLSQITTSVKFKCKICIDRKDESIKVVYWLDCCILLAVFMQMNSLAFSSTVLSALLSDLEIQCSLHGKAVGHSFFKCFYFWKVVCLEFVSFICTLHSHRLNVNKTHEENVNVTVYWDAASTFSCLPYVKDRHSAFSGISLRIRKYEFPQAGPVGWYLHHLACCGTWNCHQVVCDVSYQTGQCGWDKCLCLALLYVQWNLI